MTENYFIVKKIYLAYMAMLALFTLLFPGFSPSGAHIFFQAFQATLILCFAYFLFQRDRGVLPFAFGLGLYLIIVIAGYRLFNIEVLGDWLGQGADGRGYTKVGTVFVEKGYSITQIFDYFKMKHIMLDDYGMFFITTAFFWFWGASWGFHLLPFLSIVPILWGGYMLYLMGQKIGLSTSRSYLLYFIWATMTYACINCSVALKENYMVFFVIASIFVLQKIIAKPTFPLIVWFVMLSSTMLLFRTAIFFILIFSLVVALLLKVDIFAKHIRLWLIIFVVVLTASFAVIVNYVGGVRGGVSSEVVGNMYETLVLGGGVFAPVLNILAALIGPIPSFLNADAFKVKYMTLFSFTSTIKIFLSFGYLYTLVYTIKNGKREILPFVLYIILHSLMIVLTFYTLHDRYQWPQYPLVLMLSLWGIDRYREDYPNGKLYKYYCYVAVGCIALFNLRVLL